MKVLSGHKLSKKNWTYTSWNSAEHPQSILVRKQTILAISSLSMACFVLVHPRCTKYLFRCLSVFGKIALGNFPELLLLPSTRRLYKRVNVFVMCVYSPGAINGWCCIGSNSPLLGGAMLLVRGRIWEGRAGRLGCPGLCTSLDRFLLLQ